MVARRVVSGGRGFHGPAGSSGRGRVVLACGSGRDEQGERGEERGRIVYCKDGKRRDSYEHTAFTFLGFTFRARGVRTKTGVMFLSFNPAVSKEALKMMSARVRSWRLHQRIDLSEADQPDRARVDELLRRLLPVGALSPPDPHQRYVMRWSRNKYKRPRNRKKAQAAWDHAVKLRPRFFAHWVWVNTVPAVW